MKVSDVIAGKEVVTARLDRPLGEVADIMKAHGITGLPIVDDWGGLAGLVSVSTILEYTRHKAGSEHTMVRDDEWSPSQHHVVPTLDWSRIEAREAMVTDLCTLGLDEDVKDAARTLINRHVHRAVVLGPDRRVVGIMSSQDLTLMVAEGKLHE